MQCSLATLTIFFILLFFNLFTQGTIIASLGATTFIVFTMPNGYSARTRNLIGGYIVGISMGVVFHVIYLAITRIYPIIEARVLYAILGALAVGITIFIMVTIDTEHPPAVGLSLGIVLSEWNYITILTIGFCITFLWTVKKLLKSKDLLIDLK